MESLTSNIHFIEELINNLITDKIFPEQKVKKEKRGLSDITNTIIKKENPSSQLPQKREGGPLERLALKKRKLAEFNSQSFTMSFDCLMKNSIKKVPMVEKERMESQRNEKENHERELKSRKSSEIVFKFGTPIFQ